jgi:hypothetical protein
MNAGKCDSCSYNGPLMEFRNDIAEPEIRFNLCPKCIRKAYMCMQFFIHTPAGNRALVKKIAEMNKPDGFTVRV